MIVNLWTKFVLFDSDVKELERSQFRPPTKKTFIPANKKPCKKVSSVSNWIEYIHVPSRSMSFQTDIRDMPACRFPSMGVPTVEINHPARYTLDYGHPQLYANVCVCIYIYIYLSIFKLLYLYLYLNIYLYTYTHTQKRAREGERERERDRERNM